MKKSLLFKILSLAMVLAVSFALSQAAFASATPDPGQTPDPVPPSNNVTPNLIAQDSVPAFQFDQTSDDVPMLGAQEDETPVDDANPDTGAY